MPSTHLSEKPVAQKVIRRRTAEDGSTETFKVTPGQGAQLVPPLPIPEPQRPIVVSSGWGGKKERQRRASRSIQAGGSFQSAANIYHSARKWRKK